MFAMSMLWFCVPKALSNDWGWYLIHILLESIDMTVGQGNASDQYEDQCQHFVTAPHFSIEITGEKVSYSVISGLSFSHHIVVWSVKIESTEIG